MNQPNIVFILIDDLGWTDLSCSGSDFYETPRLDRLAAEGMRFTDAYASCPVCSPTRASVLTGRYPARMGITNYIPGNAWGRLMGAPYLKQLPAHHVTVADLLRERGYATWHLGKWHVGEELPPSAFGFDVNVGGNGWGRPMNGFFGPWGNPTIVPEGEPGEYLTDRMTDEAVRLIEGHDTRGGERPFFLHLCHWAVHTPIEAPARLIEKYERKARDLGLDQERALEVGEVPPALHLRHERLVRRKFHSDPAYAAMIENLDASIGRVLDALRAGGLEGDTLVVFTSDNGGLSTAEGSPTCNAPLAEGKGWCREGGIRVPLIVRWPGEVEPGATCEEPVTSTDFLPTFLDAAGGGAALRPDLHRDGVSLLPLLNGGAGLGRDGIFWHYPHYSNQGGSPGCSVRSGGFKLIEWFEDGSVELFNLRSDPGESHNLAAEQPERCAELHRRLVAWREDVEATIPRPNTDYEAMRAGLVPCPAG